MADLPRLIDELNDLRKELGADLDQFINYDAFLRKRDLVEHCRRSVERTIDRLYLPDFKFASTDHARWHFRNRDFMPFWVMDFPSNEEHFPENWIRSSFVPSAKHYCYEVADALKRFDDSVYQAVASYREVKASGDRNNMNRLGQILLLRRGGKNLPPGPIDAPGGLMAMAPWTTRIATLLPADVRQTTNGSLNRWPSQAVAARRTRMHAKPPTGWYIDYISYFGKMPCPDGHDLETWQNQSCGYFEQWKWASVPGSRDPQYKEKFFLIPAPLELWSKSARRVRYEYDD